MIWTRLPGAISWMQIAHWSATSLASSCFSESFGAVVKLAMGSKRLASIEMGQNQKGTGAEVTRRGAQKGMHTLFSFFFEATKEGEKKFLRACAPQITACHVGVLSTPPQNLQGPSWRPSSLDSNALHSACTPSRLTTAFETHPNCNHPLTGVTHHTTL